MRSLFIVALLTVYSYSAQAWLEDFGPILVSTKTGILPSVYIPMTSDDQRATHKAGSFVNFIKIVPQLNPFKLPSLGPYNVELPEVNFRGELHLESVTVTGIKSLILNSLDVRMSPSSIIFNVSLPSVHADFNFKVSGSLSNQAINVQGHVNSLLSNLLVTGLVGTKIEQVYSNAVYQVDTASIFIELGDLKVNLEMSQYAEEFRKILLQFLQNLNKYDKIVDDILRAVLKAINHELTQITAPEINKFLLGSARPARSG